MTSSSTTTIAGTTVLITGANRGLGRALVDRLDILGRAVRSVDPRSRTKGVT